MRWTVTLAIEAARILYLFAPLLFSALLSAFVIRRDLLPQWRAPMDFGARLGGHRLFGDSKTWRGVVTAIVGCVSFVWLQSAIARWMPGWLVLVDYGRVSATGFGTAMGAGAMAGELPNSFVKRRLDIAPGRTTTGPLAVLFYVWDQVDLLTGAWPALALWIAPTPALVAGSFAVALAVHPIVALVGYAVGARGSAR